MQQSPSASVLVRPDFSEPEPGQEVADGTFNPGKAQAQAFYLFDCAGLDDAVSWAKRLPTRGTIEVRALIDYDLG